MFVEMVSDGVRRFPPTMQFFSTCIELLGKVNLLLSFFLVFSDLSGFPKNYLLGNNFYYKITLIDCCV